MCCKLQTQGKVIALNAIICTIWSTLGILALIGVTVLVYVYGVKTEITTGVRLGRETSALVIGIGISVYAISLVSAIVCLIGSIKNIKGLLIPFMIEKALKICMCIGAGIFSMYIAAPMLVIGCGIELGLSVYFFVTVVKYFVSHPYKATQTIKQEDGLSTAYVSYGVIPTF